MWHNGKTIITCEDEASHSDATSYDSVVEQHKKSRTDNMQDFNKFVKCNSSDPIAVAYKAAKASGNRLRISEIGDSWLSDPRSKNAKSLSSLPSSVASPPAPTIGALNDARKRLSRKKHKLRWGYKPKVSANIKLRESRKRMEQLMPKINSILKAHPRRLFLELKSKMKMMIRRSQRLEKRHGATIAADRNNHRKKLDEHLELWQPINEDDDLMA